MAETKDEVMAKTTPATIAAAKRIGAVLGTMPFGALASTRAGSGAREVVKYYRPAYEKEAIAAIDLDALATWLEALRGALEDHGDRAVAAERRADAAEEQLAALGAAFLKALPARQRLALVKRVAPPKVTSALRRSLRTMEDLHAKLAGDPAMKASRRVANLGETIEEARALVGER